MFELDLSQIKGPLSILRGLSDFFLWEKGVVHTMNQMQTTYGQLRLSQINVKKPTLSVADCFDDLISSKIIQKIYLDPEKGVIKVRSPVILKTHMREISDKQEMASIQKLAKMCDSIKIRKTSWKDPHGNMNDLAKFSIDPVEFEGLLKLAGSPDTEITLVTGHALKIIGNMEMKYPKVQTKKEVQVHLSQYVQKTLINSCVGADIELYMINPTIVMVESPFMTVLMAGMTEDEAIASR